MSAFLPWLWTTTWQVGLLVATVLLLQRLLGAWLPPRASYALWLVVVARLVLPILPADPLGTPRPFDMAGSLLQTTPPSRLLAQPPSTPAPPRTPAHPVGGRSRSAKVTRETENPTHVDSPATEPKAKTAAHVGHVSLRVVRTATQTTWSPRAASTPAQAKSWSVELVILWLGIAGLLLLRALGREWRFRRQLLHAEPVRDRTTLDLLDRCRTLMGVRRSVELLRSSSIAAPSLSGWRRPRLLLPSEERRLDGNDLRHIFLHELAHQRHADVLLNWLLVALRAIHWFNPFVHLAISRLLASQEIARDWEALNVCEETQSTRYAATLVKLLEPPSPAMAISSSASGILPDAREVRRRIAMIIRHRRPHRLAASLGILVVTLVAWAGLTRAAALDPQDEISPQRSSSRGDGDRIEVVRQDAPVAWKRELRDRLENTLVDIEVEAGSPLEVAEYLREKASVNVVIDRAGLDQIYDSEPVVNLRAKEMRLDHVLDITCKQAELSWRLARGAVLLTAEGGNPDALEIRFYRIARLLSDDAEARDDEADHLMDLIRSMGTKEDCWDMIEGTNMRFWKDLLVVQQVPEVHEDLERFLNLLLTRRGPVGLDGDTTAWRARLDEKLSKRGSVTFEETPLHEVAKRIFAEFEIAFQLPTDWEDEGVTIDLEVQDLPVRDILAWIADLSEMKLSIRDGAVWLGEQPGMHLNVYEIADLVQPGDFEEEARDELIDLLRESVDPPSWDEWPAQMETWRGLIVVRQTGSNHEKVERFLNTARRALR